MKIVYISLKLMDITAFDKILESWNIKVLLLISIQELCGQFILNMKAEHGTLQLMDGDNGNGKETNLLI